MEEKRKATMQQFFVSNALFLSEVEENKHIIVDATFKLELMFIFFLIHKKELKEIDKENFLLSMLETGDFYLEENEVVYQQKKYASQDLYNYVIRIYDYLEKKKVVFLNTDLDSNRSNLKLNTQEYQYSINPYIIIGQTHAEETRKKYISHQKVYNIKRLDGLIFSLLNGETENTFAISDVLELSTLVNLYPLCSYDAKEELIPKRARGINVSTFYKRQLNYQNSRICQIDKRLQNLEFQLKSEQERLNLTKWIKGRHKKEIIKLVKEKIQKINIEILILGEEKESIKSRPEIENPLILYTLWDSMINGTYDKARKKINTNLIFYRIESNNKINCIENSLENCAQVINNIELGKQLDQIKLKKEEGNLC